MPVVMTYTILLLGALGAIIHSVLTDPASDAFFSPKTKAILGFVGLVIATLLPRLQDQFKPKPPSTPLPPAPPTSLPNTSGNGPPADFFAVFVARAAIAYVTFVLTVGLITVSCAALLPKGESVTQTDSGVQVCVQWAKNPMTDSGIRDGGTE